ncbi:MAG: DUF305 domain-containing protein [Oceanococcaceae bacterium]
MSALQPARSAGALWLLLALLCGLGGGWMLAEARTQPEPGPSPIDIAFAQFMSLHHQQAIGMAQMMLDGRPTPLAGRARSVAYSQLLELGQMQGWLRLWDEPLQPPNLRDMNWMRLGAEPPDASLQQYLIDCERSPTGMPGLASLEQLQGLRVAEGVDKDRQFLRLLLAHHEGGLPMAAFAARNARLPLVRQLAAQITLEQSQEVAELRRSLQVMAQLESRLPGVHSEVAPPTE